jgi:hypothetical protein
MSPQARACVLLLALALSSPFLPGTLDGELSAEQSLVRFGGAFVVAWAGVALVASVVGRYQEQQEQARRDADEAERAERLEQAKKDAGAG